MAEAARWNVGNRKERLRDYASFPGLRDYASFPERGNLRLFPGILIVAHALLYNPDATPRLLRPLDALGFGPPLVALPGGRGMEFPGRSPRLIR